MRAGSFIVPPALAALALCQPVAAQRRPQQEARPSPAVPGLAVPADLDSHVARVLREFDTPGAAIAVVRDGRVVLARGYGVRRLGGTDPVDAHTVFQVASNTKAVTAAVMAMLVDEGRVRWEDRVVDHLPWFLMHDPYVTRELTVLDLFVHRSGLGLGAGDLLWFHSDFTREELVRRLRWIRPATSFRSAYAYDNVLYVVAGAVVEAVGGRSWDDLVRERVFRPLGMTTASTSVREFRPGDNVASAHAVVDGRPAVVPHDVVDNIGPGGSINASVADWAEWVRVQLDSGRVDASRRLWSAARTTDMWAGRTLTPTPRGATLSAYALGWNVYDFRGTKVVTHTGGLSGMVSRVMLFPQLRTGFVILTNAESSAMGALTNHLRDFYTGAPATDWVGEFRRSGADSEAAAFEARLDSSRARGRGPSLPLAEYAGTYRDAWYGDVAIEAVGDRLAIRFSRSPNFTGDLEHWHYDTFRVHWRVRHIPDAWVTFALNPDGSIELVRMAAVSPAADFSYDWHDLDLRPVPRGGTGNR